MSEKDDKERFHKQLENQLRFLRNSCRLYDMGHKEEALRMAVQIENLIGLRKSATSVVKHLGATDVKIYSTAGQFAASKENPHAVEATKRQERNMCFQTFMLTVGGSPKIERPEDLYDNVDSIHLYLGFGLLNVGKTARESFYAPNLRNPNEKGYGRLVSIKEWMDEIVLITKRQFYLTRAELISVARNQDGGGHIAPTLKGDKIKGSYLALSRDASIGYFHKNGFVVFTTSNEKRFGKNKVSVKGVHYVALRQMSHELLNSHDILALEAKHKPSDI